MNFLTLCETYHLSEYFLTFSTDMVSPQYGFCGEQLGVILAWMIPCIHYSHKVSPLYEFADE